MQENRLKTLNVLHKYLETFANINLKNVIVVHCLYFLMSNVYFFDVLEIINALNCVSGLLPLLQSIFENPGPGLKMNLAQLLFIVD